MKNKATLNNIISSFILQIVTIISGFIIPRIVLLYFGSSVNGLVSSINQFLSYITLVEGGVTGVVAANLYEPLVKGDFKTISSVAVTSKKFFSTVGYIFIGYAIFLAFVYPLLVDVQFDYLYVCTLVLVLSISLSIQFLFSLTLRVLLNTDKRGYIVNNIQILITALNIPLAYLSVKIYPNIHVLKFISGCLFILQPIVFGQYVKKNYDIDWKEKADNNLINERWNGFAINVAAFIHNCTDITLLTFFSTLDMVSIYSVYAIVTSGLKNLVLSVAKGINPTLGHAYAKGDYEELNQKLDLYEFIIFLLVFFAFAMAALLIRPFAMIYTSGVTDTDYNRPVFGILLVLAEAIYLIKLPHMELAYVANKYKSITIPAFIEAGINIAVSLAFIKDFGLVGVAIGTVAAMFFRMIFHVYFTKSIVPGRKQRIYYKKVILFLIGTAVVLFICVYFLPLKEYTISNWITNAIEYAGVLGVTYLGISYLFFKNELSYLWNYLKRRTK